jgi:hypothetical protein
VWCSLQRTVAFAHDAAKDGLDQVGHVGGVVVNDKVSLGRELEQGNLHRATFGRGCGSTS